MENPSAAVSGDLAKTTGAGKDAAVLWKISKKKGGGNKAGKPLPTTVKH